MENNALIQHIRNKETINDPTSPISKQYDGNKRPNMPDPNILSYGEIALNYAKGYETIIMKNDHNDNVYIPFNLTDRTLKNEKSIDDLKLTTIEEFDYLSGYTKHVQNELDNHIERSNNEFDSVWDAIETIAQSGENETLIEITYNKLKSLRNNNQLIPGYWYRITDYQCTTSQLGTQVAHNQFDIIVFATSTNSLSEEAKAIMHRPDNIYDVTFYDEVTKKCYITEVSNLYYLTDCETLLGEYLNGEINIDETNKTAICDMMESSELISENQYYPHFIRSNLNAWKIWYSIDNDTSRFEWATGNINGRGVIYRMIDEFNNDCPYDFKNILFTRYKIKNCQLPSNMIDSYVADIDNDSLSADTSTSYMTYTFAYIDDNDAIYDTSVIQPNIRHLETNNTYGNIIKPFYKRNVTTSKYRLRLPDNVFVSDETQINKLGFTGYYLNTLMDNCYSNTFGNDTRKNTLGANCNSNTFNMQCHSNTFVSDCIGNILSSGFELNSFGTNCSYNIVGVSFYSNTFGNDCSYNVIGGNGTGNLFGNNCQSNSLGFYKGEVMSYFHNIIFDNGNCNISLITSPETSEYNICQNVRVTQGVNNQNSEEIGLELKVLNNEYQIFIGRKTNGDIIGYNPNDLSPDTHIIS